MKFFDDKYINTRSIIYAFLLMSLFIALARAVRQWYEPEGVEVEVLENDPCQLYCDGPLLEAVKWIAQTTKDTPGFSAPDSKDIIKVNWTPELVEIAKNILHFCAEQICAHDNSPGTCFGSSISEYEKSNFRWASSIKAAGMSCPK